jgi:hypothetical protein
MGRGRQKAKQTKVARQLKYFSPETDYDALANELHRDAPTSAAGSGEQRSVDSEAEDDDYADWESSYR